MFEEAKALVSIKKLLFWDKKALEFGDEEVLVFIKALLFVEFRLEPPSPFASPIRNRDATYATHSPK